MPRNRKVPPARTPEQLENYMINLAINLAEKKLKDGSAPSQLITHFLKLATTREKLENEKLRSDLRVAEAKIQQMQSAEDIARRYEDAMRAMKTYSGSASKDDEEYYDD